MLVLVKKVESLLFFRTLFNSSLPKVNELFFPGRMAYIMDLEEEFPESDIPTTTIRSKADIEGTVSQQTTLSTNDIVINKLTQVKVPSWNKQDYNLAHFKTLFRATDSVVLEGRIKEQEKEEGQARGRRKTGG